MRDIGIELVKDNATIAVMACENDNEALWYEINDCEFNSSIVDGLKLSISDDKYRYKLSTASDIGMYLIDLKNNQYITDYISLDNLLGDIRKNRLIQVKNKENNEIEISYNNSQIIIREIKLITLNSRNKLLEFIM